MVRRSIPFALILLSILASAEHGARSHQKISLEGFATKESKFHRLRGVDDDETVTVEQESEPHESRLEYQIDGPRDVDDDRTAFAVHESGTRQFENEAMDEDWTVHTDPDTGRKYYYNAATDESRWEKPEESKSRRSNAADDETSTNAQESEPQESRSTDGDEDDEEWAEYTDPDSGRKYYYNAVTDESRWEKPEESGYRIPAAGEKPKLGDRAKAAAKRMKSKMKTKMKNGERKVKAKVEPKHMNATSVTELEEETGKLEEEVIAKFIDVPIALAIVASLFLGGVVERLEIEWLPESAVTIAIGACLGFYMKATIGHLAFFEDEHVFNETCSTFLNLFLLPILMFEAGWSMRYKDFASQFQYIMLFAVVGSLISFIVVGSCILVTGRMGLHGVRFPRTAFAYASLIAATDPVATLATYSKLKVDALLNMLVFGDSIFNDAVAIVLFKVLNNDAIMGTFDSRPSLQELAGHISWGIFSIFFGSVGIGFGIGAIFLLVLKSLHMRDSPRLEVLSLAALAYVCFAFAETLEMSGIIATMFCSILVGIYARYHLSNGGALLGSYFLKQIATLMDTCIFLLIGFCTVRLGKQGLLFGSWAMLFCLLGRAGGVFPVALLTNAIKRKVMRTNRLQESDVHLISEQAMFMMWHASLRGAISLTLTMQLGDWVDKLDGKGTREIMQTGTYILIIVFLFVFGGSTTALLHKFKIPMGETTPSDALYKTEALGWEQKLLARIHDKVMLPLFVGKGQIKNIDDVCDVDVEDVLEKNTAAQASLAKD